MLALSQPPATEFADGEENDGSAPAASKPAQFLASLPKMVCPPAAHDEQCHSSSCYTKCSAMQAPHTATHVSYPKRPCRTAVPTLLHTDSQLRASILPQPAAGGHRWT